MCFLLLTLKHWQWLCVTLSFVWVLEIHTLHGPSSILLPLLFPWPQRPSLTTAADTCLEKLSLCAQVKWLPVSSTTPHCLCISDIILPLLELVRQWEGQGRLARARLGTFQPHSHLYPGPGPPPWGQGSGPLIPCADCRPGGGGQGWAACQADTGTLKVQASQVAGPGFNWDLYLGCKEFEHL